uniref:Uncharacterized protein n=1 Tax=Anguilla anguilla TaxID=7936 RepID=A0A0E9WPD9_ANGAN
MLTGSKSTLSKTPNFSITIDGFPYPTFHSCELGVILDSTFSFEPHVKHITGSAFFPSPKHIKTQAHPVLLDNRNSNPCLCNISAGLL